MHLQVRREFDPFNTQISNCVILGFRAFQQINQDYKVVSTNKAVAELRTFGKYLIREFFKVAETNKKVFMESLFWTTTREAAEVEGGYDKDAVSASEKQKRAFWSEENEETLTRFSLSI